MAEPKKKDSRQKISKIKNSTSKKNAQECVYRHQSEAGVLKVAKIGINQVCGDSPQEAVIRAKKPMFLAFLVTVILGLLPKGAMSIPAKTLTEELSKTLIFQIPTNHPNRTRIKVSWLATYHKRPPKTPSASTTPQNSDENSNTPKIQKFDPKLTLISVMTDGVYMLKMNQTWREIDPENLEQDTLKALKYVDPKNQITMSQMDGNDTILTVAYQNLTIEVIDVLKSAPGAPKIIQKIDLLERSIEPWDDQISALYRIPYSEELILAPGRFEMVKINRLTGELKSEKNALGHLKFMVGPLRTDRPSRDPHNPNKSLRSSSKASRIHEIESAQYFVFTSKNTSMNAVGDFTTLKPIHFWSLKLYDKASFSSERSQNYKLEVTSICWSGYQPGAHLYLANNKNMDSIVLFNGIYQKLDSVYWATFGISYLTWLNGTSFVYMTLENGLDAFLDIDNWKNSGARFSSLVHDLDMVFLELEKSELGEQLPPGSLFDRLDWLYLNLYVSEENLILSPPTVCWGECFLCKEYEGMFYGRMRGCSNQCKAGFRPKIQSIKSQEEYNEYVNSDVLVDCVPFNCPLDEETGQTKKIHINWFYELYTKDANKTHSGVDPEISCQLYTPTEAEKGYVNDNGCMPGFNLNTHGVCQACADAYCSDCYSFYEGHGVCLSLNPFNYTFKDRGAAVPFKGHEGVFKDKGVSSYFNRVFGGGPLKSFKHGDSLWFYQSRPRVKDCYQRTSLFGSFQKYQLTGRRGYSLKLMHRYPQYDFSSQKSHHKPGNNSSPPSQNKDPLDRYFCFKNCPVGHFYDFESISCRRCYLGCADCEIMSKCKLCIPGWRPYMEPKNHPESFKKSMMGNCVEGCQIHFYSKSFNGDCEECPKLCDFCIDRKSRLNKTVGRTERELRDNQRLNRLTGGFCLRCEKVDEKKRPLYADLKFGECVTECGEKGRFKVKLKSEDGELVNACAYCLDEKCLKCSIHDAADCEECEEGYRVDASGGCRSIGNERWMNYSLVALLVVILVLVCLLLNLFSKTSKTERNAMKEFQNRRNLMMLQEGVTDFSPGGGGRLPPGLKGKKVSSRFLSTLTLKNIFLDV